MNDLKISMIDYLEIRLKFHCKKINKNKAKKISFIIKIVTCYHNDEYE